MGHHATLKLSFITDSHCSSKTDKCFQICGAPNYAKSNINLTAELSRYIIFIGYPGQILWRKNDLLFKIHRTALALY